MLKCLLGALVFPAWQKCVWHRYQRIPNGVWHFLGRKKQELSFLQLFHVTFQIFVSLLCELLYGKSMMLWITGVFIDRISTSSPKMGQGSIRDTYQRWPQSFRMKLMPPPTPTPKMCIREKLKEWDCSSLWKDDTKKRVLVVHVLYLLDCEEDVKQCSFGSS